MSNKPHPYKFNKYTYVKNMNNALKEKLDIFVTYDTPAIPVKYANGDNYIGNEIIYQKVDEYKPKIHFYGHCHHPSIFNNVKNVYYVNVDALVLIFIPKIEVQKDDELINKKLFKYKLCDLNSPNLHKLIG